MRFLVVLALLAGCENKELTQLERVKQEVCACKDVACAEAAMKRVPTGDIYQRITKEVGDKEMIRVMKLAVSHSGLKRPGC